MKKSSAYTFFLLSIIFLVSFSFNNEYTNNVYSNEEYPNESYLLFKDPFIIGMWRNPGEMETEIDPQNADNSVSYNVIDQVCEGLFAYNLSDPNMTPIPNLATGYGTWSEDGLNWTLPLRTGVTFHDGTPFNVTAVKWTFDRLAYLSNHTNNLNSTLTKSSIHELYEFSDGMPIINRLEVISEYLIKFVLNRPYTALQGLFCFTGSYILSPSSTPFDRFLEILDPNDFLIGTGPFVYDHYIADVEVKLHAYEDYWKGKADIDDLIFSIIKDPTKRNDAMLNGSVHFITGIINDLHDTYKADPNITFVEKPSSRMSYLSMNNKVVNLTWRRAISHSINYTYIIKDYWKDDVVKLKSPVPEGILFSNYSLDYPTINLTRARKIIYDALSPYNAEVAGRDINVDADWDLDLAAPQLIAFNYSYNTDNAYRWDLYPLLRDWLGQIGIKVTDGGTDWAYFLYRAYGYIPGGYDDLELFWVDYNMDFNDPSDYVNTLFSNASLSNNAQVNDPYLENLLAQGLEETDPNLRKQIYNEIQLYLIEDLMPIVLGYSIRVINVYHKDLTGFKQNALNRMFFYSCSWNRTRDYSYEIEITSPPDITFVEGTTGHNINWMITSYNISTPSYSIYRNTTLLKNGEWTSGASIISNVDNLSIGTHEYKIVVQNEREVESDTVKVTVKARPIVEIIHPNNNTICETAPIIIIDVFDEKTVNSTWYVVDGYNPKYFFSGTVIFFNTELWDELPPGVVIIKVYVNDTLGIENFVELHIIKSIPEEGDSNGNDAKESIPFGNIYFLLFVLTATVILNLKRKRYKFT